MSYEIRREAQHVEPMEPVSAPQSSGDTEEMRLDDFGEVLESLPLARPGSPVRQRRQYYDFSDMPPLKGVETAEEYMKSARKTGDLQLEFQLAQYMLQTALSEPSSENSKFFLKEALSSLKRLSERGYAHAQYLLGDIYSSAAVKTDFERSFKYFLMAAKHGHAEAAYRAALCLQEGWGTQRDARRALQFYRAAAVRNQPGALYQMGMAYFHGGLGVPDTSANRQAGVKWLQRAANVADSTYNKAPHALARIFEVGFKDLVIPDSVYAAQLYARSAELGYIPAAARLGEAYEHGELGCPQDASLSIHYYTVAALGNDPKAQLAMCAWYMVGAKPDFKINRDEAFEWALRAALNGLPKAQYTIGFFLENGIGTKRDVIEASKWYHKAADAGYEKAKEKVGRKNERKCLVM